MAGGHKVPFIQAQKMAGTAYFDCYAQFAHNLSTTHKVSSWPEAESQPANKSVQPEPIQTHVYRVTQVTDQQTHSLPDQRSGIETVKLLGLRCDLFIKHLMHAELYIFKQ